MAKLTYEDKKEIIRLYDKEHHGPRYIAELFNVNKSSVVNVINKYWIIKERYWCSF